MLTCSDAIISNMKTKVSNFDALINYYIRRNELKRRYERRVADEPRLIQEAYNKIDSDFREGFYVQPRYNNPAITQSVLNSIGASDIFSWYNRHLAGMDGDLLQCTGDGSGTCCYSHSAESNTKCCACGRYRRDKHEVNNEYMQLPGNKSITTNGSCNSGGGCLDNCNWSIEGAKRGCNEKLRTNLFQNEITRLKNEALNSIKRQTEAIMNEYLIYSRTSEPQIRLMELGCCQSIEYDRLFATNINISSNQTCTIANN